MTGAVIRAELPLTTDGLNDTLRKHWAKRTAYQRRLSWELLVALNGQKPPAPFARAKVRIERHSAGELDTDNFYGGLKPLIDCLLPPGEVRIVRGKRVLAHPGGLAIVADDKPDVMQLEAVQVRAPRGVKKTIITITELPNA